MNWNYLLLSLSIFFCFLNTIILFFAAAFLVRLKNDLINLIATKDYNYEVPLKKVKDPKTWDQKYEEELKVISQRISENSKDI